MRLSVIFFQRDNRSFQDIGEVFQFFGIIVVVRL